MTVLSLESCRGGVTGDTVRRLRKELFLSQRGFGALIGTPPTTIASQELRGKRGLLLSEQARYRAIIARTYEGRLTLKRAHDVALKLLNGHA